MLKKIIFHLFLFTLLFSCKKEKQPAPQNPTPNSPYSVSTASVFSGFFSSVKWTDYVNPMNDTTGSYSDVFFFGGPIYMPINGMGLKINNLKCSNQTFLFDTVYTRYRNYPINNFNSEFWQVSGNSGIPSFNFFNNATPNCNSFHVIPDSISKSTGFTFSINGVVNVTTTGFEFSLFDGMNGSLNIYKPIYNGNNQITISPAELSALSLTTGGNNGSIYISFESIQDLNFYGSDFRFSKRNMFSKPIKICP